MGKEFILLFIFILLFLAYTQFSKSGSLGKFARRNLHPSQTIETYKPHVNVKVLENPPKYLSEPIKPKKAKNSNVESKVSFFPVVRKRVVDQNVPTAETSLPENILSEKNIKLRADG